MESSENHTMVEMFVTEFNLYLTCITISDKKIDVDESIFRHIYNKKFSIIIINAKRYGILSSIHKLQG